MAAEYGQAAVGCVKAVVGQQFDVVGYIKW